MSYPDIRQPVLVLVGPTAIGKTALSLQISELASCEIISMDSMQVYRYMDIGTAKASVKEREYVPHYLIDIVDPDQQYNASSFVEDALAAMQQIHRMGKIPLITGGTGLYLRALQYGLFEEIKIKQEVREEIRARLLTDGNKKLHEELSLCDEISAKKIHVNDSQRLTRALEVYLSTGEKLSTFQEKHRQESKKPRLCNCLCVGLTTSRDILYANINKRCLLMKEQGLEGEVENLLDRGYSPDLSSMQSIGYKHITNYLKGIWGREEAYIKLARDTRRYAKRQFTWFNNDPSIEWMDVNEPKLVLNRVSRWLDVP